MHEGAARGRPVIFTLLLARALRAFADGYVSVLLPAYLIALGMGTWQVGVLATTTLLGSALATLAIGTWGHRFHHGRLLSGAALLMAGTGFAFAASSAFWPLLLVAFVGTLNPSSGDVSVFLPLEHARIADAADGDSDMRTALFARYSLVGSLLSAFGALAAGLPALLMLWTGLSSLGTLRAMFVLYGLVGLVVWVLYQRLPLAHETQRKPPAPLGPSRGVVIRLAALFSVDAFAGGLIVNALMALWMFERFGLSVASAGQFFFWAGLCSAASQLAAPRLARRIGLLNTMVVTQILANLCLIAAAFAPSLPMALGLLIVRGLLSQMDIPARASFVMSSVTPDERAAAASFTLVPRSLATAAGPSLGGALLATGMLAAPLVVCGVLKISYDLAIWRAFRNQPLNPTATPAAPAK